MMLQFTVDVDLNWLNAKLPVVFQKTIIGASFPWEQYVALIPCVNGQTYKVLVTVEPKGNCYAETEVVLEITPVSKWYIQWQKSRIVDDDVELVDFLAKEIQDWLTTYQMVPSMEISFPQIQSMTAPNYPNEQIFSFQIPYQDIKIHCTLTQPKRENKIYFLTESPWNVVFTLEGHALEKKYVTTTISGLEYAYREFLLLAEKEIEDSKPWFYDPESCSVLF